MKGDRFQAENASRDASYERQKKEEFRKIIFSLEKQLEECKKERDDWKSMALKK